MSTKTKLHVGICGGGLGGLAAAIASARAGAKVTVLEAAKELGEIGAGIQVFPNVSRLFIRWGIDEIIGDNLIAVDEVNTWGIGNELLTRFDPKLGKKQAGFPHWLARRDHLHAGLTEGARRLGVEFVIDSRVDQLEYSVSSVKVTTTRGKIHEFDLLIGADGIKSTIRQKLFPGVVPKAASTVAAFRGILSYEDVFKNIPEAQYRLRNTMDAFVGPNGYILLYPLTGGRELNVVTLFQMDRVVTTLEEIAVEDFRKLYKDWDEFPRKILEMVNHTSLWPLLVMPPMKTWSNEQRNVVLLGDAAHSMQNHMAQGAATAMEDGAFLGAVLSEVIRGIITLPQAIHIYESRRIPKTWVKQQASFMQGAIATAVGKDAVNRDRSALPEVTTSSRSVLNVSNELSSTYRSWQMYLVPSSVPGILYYDPEGDADNAVCEWLQANTPMDEKTLVTEGIRNKYWSVIENAETNGIH